MRVPFNWLKEFTPVSAAASDVADSLTMRGLEVEAVEQIIPRFSEVYVGRVLEVETIRLAEKLSLCRVDVGTDILPIVCGAPNVARGRTVAVAVPGGRLADNSVIEKKRLVGVDSYGMLCSEKELGLSDDHSGIFVLPDDLKTGEPLDRALGIADYVLDVNVPPNRGDCQSILGIAREVAGIYGLDVTLPSFTLNETDAIDGLIRLSVADTEACPRYVLRMVRGISIVPAPFWMRNRITKAGMRPINAIVDVTNYVMLELGQPLHAFDYARIGGTRIEVRVADEKSVFRTLDGQDRALVKGDILICDGSGPVALAGVMGGENSEISAATKDVALESAFFNPLLIRQTARRLDLRSEASARFEKGIDIENVDYAARRAVELMQRTSGGVVLAGSLEVYEKQKPATIRLSLQRTRDLIGTPLSREEVVDGLASIGIKLEGGHPSERQEARGVSPQPLSSDAETLCFSVPSFRHDLKEYVDLIEEVARIAGYDAVPASAPVSPLLPVSRGKRDTDIDAAKTYLAAAGFFEVINYGFFGVKDIENFRLQAPDERTSFVPILNPISKELGVMRTFLAARLLENIAYNGNRGTKNLRIFEVGKVFFRSDGAVLPRESMHLACAISGKEREYFWRDTVKEFDFFDLKGVLEGLFERFNLQLRVEKAESPFLESTEGADLFANDRKVGWIGALRESVRAAYNTDEKVWCSELDLDVLGRSGTRERAYRPIPRYPAVVRDFSFYVPDQVPVADLVEGIAEVSPLIVSVGVFDTFKKEVRSISFRVVFQSYEDTLTDGNVNGLQQIIIDRLTMKEGIKLRT
ncbi:MAG: phenylalanine--tRNA ligase subunit beta [Syntrophorhabdales bacterium]|jgi:phenylalanyl-tRNA synthetase beta chain